MFKGMTGAGKILLIASLALNLAIVGLFLGHRISHWGGKKHHGLKHHILKVVPENKRDAVAKIINDHHAKYPRKRGHFKQKWEELEVFLRAENFDRDQFLAVFQANIEKQNQRRLDGGKAIADIAQVLTAQERNEVLNKLKKKWRKHRRFFKKRHEDKQLNKSEKTAE